MDKTTLVDADLQAGQHIVEQLESLGITVDVAAWLQDEETCDWRLVLSSPSLTKPGSRRMYDAIVSIVRKLDGTDLDLDNIRVLSPHNGIVSDLKNRVRTSHDLQEIRLDGLHLGGQSYRSARIYRVASAHDAIKIEHRARVRVKATGQLGTVHGIVRTSGGPRYLVLYDISPDDVRPLDEKPRPPVGQDYAASDLDLLYVVRSAGWPERNPDWLVAATSSNTEPRIDLGPGRRVKR